MCSYLLYKCILSSHISSPCVGQCTTLTHKGSSTYIVYLNNLYFKHVSNYYHFCLSLLSPEVMMRYGYLHSNEYLIFMYTGNVIGNLNLIWKLKKTHFLFRHHSQQPPLPPVFLPGCSQYKGTQWCLLCQTSTLLHHCV